MGITLATGALAAVAVALWCLRLRALGAVPAFAGAGVVVVLLAYLVWRGMRPLLPANVPAPRSGTFDGAVWHAAGSARPEWELLVNIAEAVRGGGAAVSSPTGAALGPDRFVDVRPLTITDQDLERGFAGTSRREWLFLHPPSRVSVDVALPAGRQVWFQAALGMDPEMWNAPTGDGVRYRVTVAPRPAQGEGAPMAVLDRAVNPRAKAGDRRWLPVEVDLGAWSGQTVRLTLETLPGDDLSFDWAGWGNPLVVIRDSGRERPPVGGG
jgi:hypothetical protein